MNLSGKAFKYWMDKEKVALENTLTIVDDLALPLNRLRIRGSGTHGGHNGLLDIETILGTDAYPKLRFGIGRDFPKGMQSEFVLGKWKPEELPMVRAKIKVCVEAIENFAVMGLQEVMGKYNNLEVQADNKNGHTFHF
jgi:PTH1 family peptidyl-tRNA hydrolase